SRPVVGAHRVAAIADVASVGAQGDRPSGRCRAGDRPWGAGDYGFQPWGTAAGHPARGGEVVAAHRRGGRRAGGGPARRRGAAGEGCVEGDGVGGDGWRDWTADPLGARGGRRGGGPGRARDPHRGTGAGVDFLWLPDRGRRHAGGHMLIALLLAGLATTLPY